MELECPIFPFKEFSWFSLTKPSIFIIGYLKKVKNYKTKGITMEHLQQMM
jgi:hypothetical protein